MYDFERWKDPNSTFSDCPRLPTLQRSTPSQPPPTSNTLKAPSCVEAATAIGLGNVESLATMGEAFGQAGHRDNGTIEPLEGHNLKFNQMQSWWRSRVCPNGWGGLQWMACSFQVFVGLGVDLNCASLFEFWPWRSTWDERKINHLQKLFWCNVLLILHIYVIYEWYMHKSNLLVGVPPTLYS